MRIQLVDYRLRVGLFYSVPGARASEYEGSRHSNFDAKVVISGRATSGAEVAPVGAMKLVTDTRHGTFEFLLRVWQHLHSAALSAPFRRFRTGNSFPTSVEKQLLLRFPAPEAFSVRNVSATKGLPDYGKVIQKIVTVGACATSFSDSHSAKPPLSGDAPNRRSGTGGACRKCYRSVQ